MYEYDKDGLKNSLSIDQVAEYVAELGGEPYEKNGVLLCKTICHGGESHKLYYYPNTTLFKCYTDCGGEAFDIFELTRKVLSRERPKAREDSKWSLPEAIDYVAQYFHFAPNQKVDTELLSITDELELFEKYDRIKDININTQEVELKEYDGAFLKHLPHPNIQPWIDEGITQEVMNQAGICYDPKNQGIVIPHYDINNRLIGIRERTLIQEQAETYGKYMPARIAGKMYNHPLSFSVYNLNHSKENIQKIKKAIVFESEKSCLKYRSFFGEENDISCAICGSSFIQYQAWLLINQGAKEIVVALDHDFTDLSSEVAQRQIKNLKQIHNKYGKFVTISFLWDKENLLGYKDSPIDKSKEVFLELYKNRINLY
jgi:hypothetical protein